jgi:hypothetical protein
VFQNRAGAWRSGKEGATQDPKIIHPSAQPRRDTTSHHHPRLTTTCSSPPDTPALLFTRGPGPAAVSLQLACHSRIRARPPQHRRRWPSRSFLDQQTPLACDTHSTPAGRRTGLLPYFSYYHGNSNHACGVPAQVYPAVDCAPTYLAIARRFEAHHERLNAPRGMS